MPSEPKCVLVVDDSAMFRQMVSSALKEAGYRVVTAVDGIDALEKLAATPETVLVVCDISMPRMNGHELLEAVKRDGMYKGPVVMLSADSGEPVARAKALGARACLPKPFQRNVLVATVGILTS